MFPQLKIKLVETLYWHLYLIFKDNNNVLIFFFLWLKTIKIIVFSLCSLQTEESIAFAKVFDFRFLMDLHVLGGPKYDLTIFENVCLSACLHVCDKIFVASVAWELRKRISWKFIVCVILAKNDVYQHFIKIAQQVALQFHFFWNFWNKHASFSSG